jgi:two-component system response regulator HydG
VVFSQKEEIDTDALPEYLRSAEMKEISNMFNCPLGQSLDMLDKRYIQDTLIRVEGNRTRAAEILGISRRTLQRKLKELGIENG